RHFQNKILPLIFRTVRLRIIVVDAFIWETVAILATSAPAPRASYGVLVCHHRFAGRGILAGRVLPREQVNGNQQHQTADEEVQAKGGRARQGEFMMGRITFPELFLRWNQRAAATGGRGGVLGSGRNLWHDCTQNRVKGRSPGERPTSTLSRILEA